MDKSFLVVVKGYDSGLNELLDAQYKAYDRRTKRMRVNNPVKAKNDRLCERYIRQSSIFGTTIECPIQISYKFYVPGKKHDRSNFASAFIKSFEDALQHTKVIKNDTYDLVLDPIIYFEICRDNPRVECELILRPIKKGNK